jgi:Phage integrase family
VSASTRYSPSLLCGLAGNAEPGANVGPGVAAGRYRDVVPVLALAGLRWGELAGLQVGDRVSVPGPGLRLHRAVLASDGGGALYVDTLKNNQARTVPLVLDLLPIVDRWSAGKAPGAWLFDAPEGGPLRESNWKRSVGWSTATATAGLHGFRVHDLRHTAASIWLGAGADPKVVQRVLGHATAAMTMDLYGHLVDDNLWQAAQLVGDISGTSEAPGAGAKTTATRSQDKMPGNGSFSSGAAYRNRTDDLRITSASL